MGHIFSKSLTQCFKIQVTFIFQIINDNKANRLRFCLIFYAKSNGKYSLIYVKYLKSYPKRFLDPVIRCPLTNESQ